MSALRHAKSDELILLRLPEVSRRCGLGRSEIYRKIKAGGFPKPIKIGVKASAWPSPAIDSWIASRIAAASGVEAK